MASITTRETGTTGVGGVTRKDAPLLNSEIDTNFINLNNNKLESDWTGNTSIVTLGTIVTGTWQGSVVQEAYGGTGESNYSPGQLLIGNSSSGLTKTTLTGTTNQITVTNGNGSITLSTPQNLHTSANVQFNSLGIGTPSSNSQGEIRALKTITAWYSDERLKENIELIPDALSKVNSLRGVSFNANDIAESYGYDKSENHVGVIAQDVKEVLPEAVVPAPFDRLLFEGTEISKSGNDYMTVQYEKLVPLLVEAIKELSDKVKELESR